MSEKISQYTEDATSMPIQAADYLDFSNNVSPAVYDESKKILVSEFLTYLNGTVQNLYNANGILAGDRAIVANGNFTKWFEGDVIAEMTDEITGYGFLVQDSSAGERARMSYDPATGSGKIELATISGVWFDANDDNLNFGLVQKLQINSDGSFALGLNAVANDFRNVVIGNAADSGSCPQAVVIGDNASSPTGTAANVIIGALATTSSNSQAAVSIGLSSTSADQGTSVGKNTISGVSAVAVGTNASSSGGVAVGGNASAPSRSVAVGLGAIATDTGMSIGHGSTALVSGGMAIGYLITSVGNSAIGIGVLAVPTGTRSIAIGRSVESVGIESIAIGYESVSSSTDSMGIGRGSAATAIGAQMIGYGDNTNKITNSTADSIGFGWDTLTPDVLFAKTADQYIAGTGDLGIGLKTPLEKLHSSAKVRANTGFNFNGNDGITQTLAFNGVASDEVTELVVEGGIITGVTLVP